MHEANRTPYYLDAKRLSLRHIITRLSEINDKKRILKTARVEKKVMYREPPLGSQEISQQVYRPGGSEMT